MDIPTPSYYECSGTTKAGFIGHVASGYGFSSLRLCQPLSLTIGRACVEAESRAKGSQLQS
eukprot:365093-Chlamydomonas_euryale.AAC.4